MIAYPNINPIALQLGSLKIYWYGIMYVIGFGAAWLLANYRAKHTPKSFTSNQISDLIFYCAIGVILGGRLGYILFYDLPDFITDPSFVFKIWEGGMSFHGAFIGVIIAMYLASRKNKKSFLATTDFICPLVPIGLMLGRIGNFINGELWGKITTVPWGMIFPTGGNLPRHPSQIYEALLEGLALFLFLWIYSAKPRKTGNVSAMFVIGYGTARIICEFFRKPDVQLGYIAFNWVTMGQLLSLPMIIIGVWILVRNRVKKIG